MLLEWLVSCAICQLLDLLSNNSIVLLGKFGILTLEFALDSLLLHLESLFISSLLLHLIHEDLIAVDLLFELVCITTLVFIDSTQVFFELVSVLLVFSGLGSSVCFDLTELLSLLELSLVLSASPSRF